MKFRSVYMLGCGGMGMAPLAYYLNDQSYKVWGWDDYLPETERKALNKINWQSTPPEDCDICIYSSALSPTHPILLQAQQRCPCIRRGDFAAQWLNNKRLCVVCGSHGKSTTTAYLVHFFKRHHIPLNYILGARFQQQAYVPGEGKHSEAWTLFELDESDGSIDAFSPDIAVILNTDWDHPRHYPNAVAYRNTFEHLAQRTKQAVIAHQAFDTHKPQHILPIQSHTICNDMAMAIYTFQYMTGQKVSRQDIQTFPGIQRRNEVLLQTQRLTVISDYAHHPTEIKAFLDNLPATQESVVAFEPHRKSRLQCFFNAFVEVLSPIKHLYLKAPYKAFEPEDMAGPDLFKALPQAQPVERLPLEPFLAPKKATLLAFVGAGYIDKDAQQWVRNWIQAIQDCFQKHGVMVQKEATLRQASTFQIGGSALFLCEPKTVEELKMGLRLAYDFGLPITPLGMGSNMLIPETRYDGVVIRLTQPLWKTCQCVEPCTYEVGAGLPLKKFLDRMENEGIGGFEFLDGIPGTIGGALSMNAGMGSQGILDHVEEVHWVDASGEQCLSRSELQYGYRSCPQLQKGVIISARLKGATASPQSIRHLRDQLRSKRHQTQPVGFSLGCFFKNPPQGSAGQLLDKLGLKNTQVGDVYVSPQHANFILNHGRGCFQDTLQLVQYLHQRVYQARGIWLEPEIRVLGKSWETLL